MTKIIDARGLACPQPVVLTKRALGEAKTITTIVDNAVAMKNVSRMAEKSGYAAKTERRADGFYVHLTKGEAQPTVVGHAEPATGPLVLAITSDQMGSGPEELGGILARAFFHTLGEVEPLPDTIIFYNSGAKLAAEGSPVLDDLVALEAQGVQILVCGTCLGYFELKDKLGVGEVSNMYTIAETMLGAGNFVRL